MVSKFVAARLEKSIVNIRNQKVLLDADLAEMYGVETRALVQAVKRNLDRFPQDFMFQLTDNEFHSLREFDDQWGGRRSAPYAFTEQGVAMLSSVLNSSQAVQVNIEIMRAFVRIRQMASHFEDLSRKIQNLENKYDQNFKVVFQAIQQLMKDDLKPVHKIGFKSLKDK